MGLNLLIIFITFSALSLHGLLDDRSRNLTLSKSKTEWFYDGIGLFIQGVIIPLAPFSILPFMNSFFPELKGSVEIAGWIQFGLSFIVVDYLYYWNHRFFHTKNYWSLHRLHHSARILDIFATSRNSLITSFLMVYFWVQILGIFLLKDSTGFMLGLAFTFALDLYRHSGIRGPLWLNQFLGKFLIVSEHHIYHHSLKGRNRNFGANFSWWDKLHGTFSAETVLNNNLDSLPQGKMMKNILMPWRKNS